MQNIVITKPYEFVPPLDSWFWNRIFGAVLARYLHWKYGVAKREYRGVERLRASCAAGHGIVLAPNHSRPCDPMSICLLCAQAGQPFYLMASWHLFMQGPLLRWQCRRAGAFSVYREGVDRESLRAAIDILVNNRRPLVLFGEGAVTRTNDRLRDLQDGAAFIARTAAKQRAKQNPPGKVVIHPVAMHYYFDGDIELAAGSVLDEIETRLSWRKQDLRLLPRIAKVMDGLLAMKEVEYLGRPHIGSFAERQKFLLEAILSPLEKQWLSGQAAEDVIERVKRIRTALVPEMVAGRLSPEEMKRRWRILADVYYAQTLSCYPPDYLDGQPTVERILETIERMDEDLNDNARIHRPMRLVIEVGDALEVPAGRERGGAGDPLMIELRRRLEAMIASLAAECKVYRPS
jgi:1-acyl-sn-glycerol-3-phosphate acyltransferase